MNATRSLTFLYTPWSVAISVAVVLITCTLSYVAWRRSGFRRAMGLLEGMRITIVAALALILNQPEWIEEYRPEEKPAIAILWDNSDSMRTRDASAVSGNTGGPSATGGGAAGAESTRISRSEAIAELTRRETWNTLEDRMSLVLEPFAEPDAGHGSDLHQPLAAAPEKFKNLAGVVLISDGDWNEGPPPVQAAGRLRLMGVPVFTVPVGSPTRLPDLEVVSLDLPTFGVVGKSVRIPFTIDSSLPRDFVTTITLKTSDGEELSKEVRIAAMGRTSDWVLWRPKTIGDYTVSLNVPRHVDETLPDNNQMAAPISIREERLQVLVIESYPRWEYRYLRNALSRDPGVDVSCLLFHPGLSKVGGGNKDYIKKFPDGLDELSKYDVVFLGDVGTDDGQLTTEQCRLIRGIVEHQASGLVLMPGWQGRQFGLLDTELGDLFPVLMDDGQRGGWGSRTPGHFELTELGRRSLLTKLADTQEENIDVWEDLPGFQWYAPVVKAKAGSEVLCTHKDISNESGRLPLLVTRTFGAGKVLFMGTDGAWRWRKGVEDKYHYRFWGQVVRWMAYQRNMAKGESMRLFFSPDQPQMRQTVALHANVMERSGEPLAQGDVTARIVAPSGKVETVRFVSEGEEWGVFHSRFTPLEPGKHEVLLACKQTGASLTTSFFVQGIAVERVGRPARPEVLAELARVTRGKMVAVDKVDQVVRSLRELPDPLPSVRRVQLWSHPVFAALLVTCLGIFWIGRKVVGLI
ncbi:MAG: hypothetical protein FJ295_16760 [Planctomycetes bacterium]|nr:hypothetical protein [Planctomycetota bacterium]